MKHAVIVSALFSLALAVNAEDPWRGKVGTHVGVPAREVVVEPIAVHEHEAGNVDVALLEVKRTAPDVLTLKWSYTNKSGQRKQLTNERTGWPDPFRLVYGGYLLDDASHTKYEVMTDKDGHPIAPRHGGQNEFIYLAPHATLKTWAKFSAPPEEVKTINVYIPRVEPFENVPIK
jgi:hypothetical protein